MNNISTTDAFMQCNNNSSAENLSTASASRAAAGSSAPRNNGCLVCGAESSGIHYGARTCEGCKGFFKRSLALYRSYRCYFGWKCDITADTRGRCKACRFLKCINAGMSLQGIRMGRIPKSRKLEEANQLNSAASNSNESLPSPKTPVQPKTSSAFGVRLPANQNDIRANYAAAQQPGTFSFPHQSISTAMEIDHHIMPSNNIDLNDCGDDDEAFATSIEQLISCREKRKLRAEASSIRDYHRQLPQQQQQDAAANSSAAFNNTAITTTSQLLSSTGNSILRSPFEHNTGLRFAVAGDLNYSRTFAAANSRILLNSGGSFLPLYPEPVAGAGSSANNAAATYSGAPLPHVAKLEHLPVVTNGFLPLLSADLLLHAQHQQQQHRGHAPLAAFRQPNLSLVPSSTSSLSSNPLERYQLLNHNYLAARSFDGGLPPPPPHRPPIFANMAALIKDLAERSPLSAAVFALPRAAETCHIPAAAAHADYFRDFLNPIIALQMQEQAGAGQRVHEQIQAKLIPATTESSLLLQLLRLNDPGMDEASAVAWWAQHHHHHQNQHQQFADNTLAMPAPPGLQYVQLHAQNVQLHPHNDDISVEYGQTVEAVEVPTTMISSLRCVTSNAGMPISGRIEKPLGEGDLGRLTYATAMRQPNAPPQLTVMQLPTESGASHSTVTQFTPEMLNMLRNHEGNRMQAIINVLATLQPSKGRMQKKWLALATTAELFAKPLDDVADRYFFCETKWALSIRKQLADTDGDIVGPLMSPFRQIRLTTRRVNRFITEMVQFVQCIPQFGTLDTSIQLAIMEGSVLSTYLVMHYPSLCNGRMMVTYKVDDELITDTEEWLTSCLGSVSVEILRTASAFLDSMKLNERETALLLALTVLRPRRSVTATCQPLLLLARAVLVMLESIILDRRPDEGPKICNMINHLLVNQLPKVDHIGTHIVGTLPIIGEDVADDKILHAPVSAHSYDDDEGSWKNSPAAVEIAAQLEGEAAAAAHQRSDAIENEPKTSPSTASSANSTKTATSNWRPELLTENSGVDFSPETMRWLFDGWNADEAARAVIDANSFCGPFILGQAQLPTENATLLTNTSQLAHSSGFEQMQQSIQANFTQSMPDYDSAGGSLIS